MFIVYDLLFILFALLYFPCLLIRGKWHSGFKMRLGNLDHLAAEKLEGKPCLWIHAVSVGEVLAIVDLVQKLREVLPQYTIICSTVTKTGNQLAQEKLGDDCTIIYAPLDFSWVVRKFVNTINPKIYISTETEIWPNLYTALHKRSIPILQINGRISDKAFKGYQRVRFLTKRILSCVDIFCMQSLLDAQRIEQLGALKEKIRIVGNLKFDNMPSSIKIRKEDLGFREDEDLLIAGSTHPGEEDLLIDVYKKLAEEFSNLRLVIAPRHIERTDAVMQLIEKKDFKPVRFSQINTNEKGSGSIVVIDTIGHLRHMYGLAKIVFIGKTLTVGGGQNMIESASLGKPTIVGPLTQNFKDAVSIFLKEKALIQVKDSEELLASIRELLKDPEKSAAMGEAARKAVEKYQGATSKTIGAIEELLTRQAN